MPAISNDPETTVTARVFVSNLLVMGSIPPVVPAEAIAAATDAHGPAYVSEMIDALREFGIRVDV